MVVDLFRVHLILPLVRHVMRIPNDFLHQQLGIKYPIIVRHHASCPCHDGTEQSEIEEDSPTRCDFKMNKDIWVEDGR